MKTIKKKTACFFDTPRIPNFTSTDRETGGTGILVKRHHGTSLYLDGKFSYYILN